MSLTPSSTTTLSDKRIRGGETTTGMRVREAKRSPGWSLTPLNDNISIHAIFKNPVIIQNILDDPRIGGLKLVVYV